MTFFSTYRLSVGSDQSNKHVYTYLYIKGSHFNLYNMTLTLCPVCLLVGLLDCLFAPNFKKIHKNSTIADSNLIFVIHMCHMKPHILRGDMSRSRSFFKIKGQIEVKNMKL